MDVEINPVFEFHVSNTNELIACESKFNNTSIDDIIECLIRNDNIYFKNQQRNETDLTLHEKRSIAKEIFEKSKPSFLVRFGKYLEQNQIIFFKQYIGGDEDSSEIKILLDNLNRYHVKTDGIHLETKNRRYEALKHLIKQNSYFTETEMMKRNPLLYQQLVGQYLTTQERRDRDRNEENNTLVKILLEGIERDEADDKMKLQEEYENNAMEENDSDDDFDETAPTFVQTQPSTSRWGEFIETKYDEPIRRRNVQFHQKEVFITSEERELLRHEFVTLMYQSFLDGKDDFDYATVDNNDEYDNIDILGNDEEDKYFDSEEPEDLNMEENATIVESSEDELDIYMNALNQHPAVCQLSQDLEKL